MIGDMDSHRWMQLLPSPGGIEVGEDPYRSPHTGWPDPQQPVWGTAPPPTPPTKKSPLTSLIWAGNDSRELLPKQENERGRGSEEGMVRGASGGRTVDGGRMGGGVRMQARRVKTGLSADILWWSAFMLVCIVVFGGLGGGVGWVLGKASCKCARYVGFARVTRCEY